MKVCVLYRGFSAYVPRVISLLNSIGHEVYDIGWDIDGSHVKNSDIPEESSFIFENNVVSSLGRIKSVFSFTTHVWKTLRRVKPDCVHVINEDMAVLVLPMKPFLFKKLICDVRNSITDRPDLSNHFNAAILKIIQWIGLGRAAYIITPDEHGLERIKKYAGKTIIIEDSSDGDNSRSMDVMKEKFVRLYESVCLRK